MGRAIGIANAIGFRVGSKVNQKFAFATANGSKTLSITVRLPVGKTLKVNWGDETSNEYAGAGDTNVVLSKTYAGAGTYPIEFEKDWVELTRVDCNSMSLSGDVSGWSRLKNVSYISCYVNSLSGDVSSWSKLNKLTGLFCHFNQLAGDISGWAFVNPNPFQINSNNFTGALPNISCPAYFAYSCNFSDSDQTSFSVAMSGLRLDGQKVIFPTENIDKLLKSLADYYEVNSPLVSNTINMSGANMGIPTGGSSNADLTRLVGYYTAAGRTCNVLIRTS